MNSNLQKEQLPAKNTSLEPYSKASEKGKPILIGLLGLLTISAIVGIVANPNFINQQLENEARASKIFALQAIATQMAKNPPTITPQLEVSVLKMWGSEIDPQTHEDVRHETCNITLLRNQQYDHDNDSKTAARNLTVGLTIEHCADESDYLNMVYNGRILTGSIENRDVFDEIPNTKEDYAELVLLEFSAEESSVLPHIVQNIPLGQIEEEMREQTLQTCGYQEGIKDKLCLTSTLEKTKYGFEVVSPIVSTYGSSGSPYFYQNPYNVFDQKIVGVMSQIYRYSAAPYNFVAGIGPDAQDRVFQLIQAKIASTKDFVNPYSQNFQASPKNPVSQP